MARIGRLVKESIVDEVSEKLSKSPNLIVTKINRLSAYEADGLRLKLHGVHASMVVVKNRLGLRAVEPISSTGIAKLMDGTVGLIIAGDDVLQAAKALVEFIKEHEDKVTVCGAVVDGVLLDSKRVGELASLPSKPQLLAQVVLTVESLLSDVIFTNE